MGAVCLGAWCVFGVFLMARKFALMDLLITSILLGTRSVGAFNIAKF